MCALLAPATGEGARLSGLHAVKKHVCHTGMGSGESLVKRGKTVSLTISQDLCRSLSCPLTVLGATVAVQAELSPLLAVSWQVVDEWFLYW